MPLERDCQAAPNRKIHHEDTKDTKKDKGEQIDLALLRVLRAFVVNLLMFRPRRE
jgi:hypothetical protein